MTVGLPQVTLSQALFRRFPWKKVPIYWLVQLLGAFVGAFITYGLYANALDAFEGYGVRTVSKTAGLFGTFPLEYATNGEFKCAISVRPFQRAHLGHSIS